MAEAASFGQVASPERASRSPLAFGLGPVPRPPAAEGCSAASRVGLPKSRPFYFDPRKSPKSRRVRVTTERGRYHWGNVDNLGRVASVMQ